MTPIQSIPSELARIINVTARRRMLASMLTTVTTEGYGLTYKICGYCKIFGCPKELTHAGLRTGSDPRSFRFTSDKFGVVLMDRHSVCAAPPHPVLRDGNSANATTAPKLAFTPHVCDMK